MVSTRSRSAKRTQNNNNYDNPNTSTSVVIQHLLSYFHSSQELKLPELKSLYYLLVNMSLDPTICYSGDTVNLSFSECKIGPHGISLSFLDICSLSDILFKKLSEIFKNFLSTLHSVSVTFPEQESFYSDILTTAQQLNLLVRCCMTMLKLLVIDQNRLVEYGLVLHAILGRLCSLKLNRVNDISAIHFEKVFQEYKWDHTHFHFFTEDFFASLQFFEPIDHCRHFFCKMLEIFVDELLSHGKLREYFELVDCCSTSNRLFVSHPSRGDIGIVLELVSIHFCMSFSDEQTFESVDDKLFGFQKGTSRVSELGPLSALNLLQNPVMDMSPKYLQAHVISLVSESLMGVVTSQNDNKLGVYLTAFERSVILYSKHMSPSDQESTSKLSAYRGSSQPSFESFLRPATYEELNHLISKLDDSLQLQLKHMCVRSKSDLVTSAIAYASNNKELFNSLFIDEIISISSSIILNAFPDEVIGNTLNMGSETKPESIYLLVSIIKLMSCSLLQAIRCLMKTSDLDCLRTLKDLSTCKEHDFIVEVISRFRKCDVSLPIQKLLIAAMETCPEKHKKSKLMLIHFSGLLSLSFKKGIDVVSKGFISVILTLMNLFLFEEGNLDAFRLADGSELFSPYLRKENGQEAVSSRKSSLVIASKFEKFRTLYLSRPSKASCCIENGIEISPNSVILNGTPCIDDIEEDTEEDCNGSFYLKCVMKNAEKEPDFDDLADFVECKNGKDYVCWLKDREMYRKKKCERMAVIKWKKKKRTWKILKRIRS